MTGEASTPEEDVLAEPLLNEEEDAELPSSLEEVHARADELETLIDRGDAELGQGNKEAAGHRTGKVSWQMMTFILLVDMFGLGTLTLPADFARMGWVLSLLVMFCCLLGMLYSGRLFTLLSERVPRARVFDDLGKAALGKTGQRLVYVGVYTTVLINPCIFQITSMESLQQIFYRRHMSTLVSGAIVAGIITPLAQVQGLEDVAALSVIGTVGMVLAVGVAVGKLCLMDGPLKPTELIHKPDDFYTPFVALLDIIFTYGGQVNWVRYITQMRAKRHFPRSVAVTAFVMTAAYVVMGAVGYLQLGPDFDHTKPITSVLPQDQLWTPVMNAGLFVHCILAYQINLNVWTDLVLHLAAPIAKWPESRVQNPGALTWGLVSCTGIALAFLVAVLFPFFSTVAAIIASLGDLAGAYALPAIFLLTLAGSTLAVWERNLLRFIVPVTLAMSAIGLYCSIHTLVKQFIEK